MGIVTAIKSIYNFVMTLIGLAVLGFLGYFFFLNQKAEYEETVRAEERQDFVNDFQASLDGSSVSDPEALRQQYFADCPVRAYQVLEGDVEAICESWADALLERSVERGMSLADYGEMGYQLCARETEAEGYDPADYCDVESSVQDTLTDATAMALCAFDRALLYENEYGYVFSKRGDSVYLSYEKRVDCPTGLVHDYYGEELFFEVAAYNEDEEGVWTPFMDRMYEAMDEQDIDAAIAVLDDHSFGEDAEVDRWLLYESLSDNYPGLTAAVLKRNGGKVHFDDDWYDQPLSYALYNESPGAAMALIEAGADPLRPDDSGSTPIVDAARYGMLEVVKALVERGADVDGIKGSESLMFGWPLTVAANEGHVETALWLLENGAQIAPEDPERYPNWSPDYLFESAVHGGSLELVEALVAKGARSDDASAVISGAILGGNAEVLDFVFAQGYELPDVGEHDSLYDDVVSVIKENEEGHRIEQGVRMFEMLLEQGLDITDVDDSGGNKALQAVKYYGPAAVQVENDDRVATVRRERNRFVMRVIDEVLESDALVDAAAGGETMLMMAANNGQPELTRYLLEKGADPALTNEDGQTALDIAVSEGRRLGGHWRKINPEVARRYAETVIALGGSADLLEAET